MKIRLISDLHYTEGINLESFDEHFGQVLKAEPDCITLIAGDIAESCSQTKAFLEKYFINRIVYFVDGNHQVYNYEDKTLLELKDQLRTEFPATHLCWHYLENDWAFIPNTQDKVAVIGSTFYTDYEYCNFDVNTYNSRQQAWNTWMKAYGFEVKEYKPITKLNKKLIRSENMDCARDYLNDFRWGNETPSKKLSPEYYLKLNKEAKKKVVECYNKIQAISPDCKVILMTHHCLSSKCIVERYITNKANASYVSDLEKWLCKNMPNLKLVLSGHIHDRLNFTFGKDNKKYIVNPCGYIKYNEPFTGNVPFNPNLVIRHEDI